MKFITLISSISLALSSSTPGSSGAQPDLTPMALQVPSAITNEPYPQVDLTWSVANEGTGTAGSHYDALYISTNSALNGTESPFSLWYVPGPLVSGDTDWRTNRLSLPIGRSGNYYLILKTDIYNWIEESDEQNNVIVAPLKYQARPADLAPLTLQVDSSITGPPNPYLALVWGVTNLGPGTASGTWMDGLYLSTNASCSSDQTFLGSFYAPLSLAPGEVYWRTNTVRIPVTTSGKYYLSFKTDFENSIFETDMGNNTVVLPVSFDIHPPDLAPIALLAATNVTDLANPYWTIVWGVTNQGSTAANAYWIDRLFLSTNAVLDEGIDLVVSDIYEPAILPPGGVYWRTNSVRVPLSQSGSFFFIFKTDCQNLLLESNVTNNTAVLPITFTVQQPDLLPISFQVPNVVTGAPKPTVSLSWAVTNQGNGMATGYWNDQVYLSRDATLDSSDTPIYTGYEYSALGVHETYQRTSFVQIPVTQSGSYYLIFNTDVSNTQNESDTNNNVLAVPITFTILPPNLAPVALQAPGTYSGPPNPVLPLVWGVTNQGIGTASGYWSDKVYLSSDAQLDAGDQLLYTTAEWGPVAVGESYWRTNAVQCAVNRSGTYFLIFEANADSYYRLFESDLGDNTKAVPIALNILPPDLVPLTSQLPTTLTGAPNESVTLVWGITNQGTGAATGVWWRDSLYLTTNSVLSGNQPGSINEYEYGSLAPGEMLWKTNSLRLPEIESGDYFLIVQANAEHNLFESDYGNNIGTVSLHLEVQKPDLHPIVFQGPTALSAPPYPGVTLVWGVTNQGKGAAVGNWCWYDHLYLSTKPFWDWAAQDISGFFEQGPILPGQSYWRTNTLQLPIASSGTYYLFFKVDSAQNLVETDPDNNTAALSFTFEAKLPDLAPIEMQAPKVMTGPPYPRISYSWGITNQGIGPAISRNGLWTDAVGLSTNAVWDSSVVWVDYDYHYGEVPAGAVYWRTNTQRLPVTQSGSYFLLFNTDANDSLIESNHTNNVAAVPIQLNIVRPDLAPIALQVPGAITGPPNPNITFVWGVTNQGLGPAVGYDYWYDQLTLTNDSSSTILSSLPESGPIEAGDSYWRTNTVRVPIVQSGSYFLQFHTDAGGSLYESNDTNNILTVPVTFDIQPPDLVPLIAAVSNAFNGPPNPTLTLVWGVTNQGTGAAIGAPYWADRIYFSKDSTYDLQDPLIADVGVSGPLEPRGVLWQTNTVHLPALESGDYYLFFAVNSNAYSQIYESNYSNNMAGVPITLNIQKPDLVPTELQVPRLVTAPPNPTVTFIWGVTNQGTGPAILDRPFYAWFDALFLSTNSVASENQTYICSGYEPGPLPPGASYHITNSVSVPVTSSGTFYVLLQVDANHFLHESDETNNVLAVPVTFEIQPPDLAPVSFQVPTVVTGAPNPRLSLVWGVTNQGIGQARGYWRDTLYLSTNSTLDASAGPVSSFDEYGPTDSGGTYWRTNWVTLPVTQDGNYFLIFQADVGNSLCESSLSNNWIVEPVKLVIRPPDLTPVALKVPAQVVGPANPSLNLVWGVTNQGLGACAQGSYWVDRVYLSSDPVLDRWSDQVIATHYEWGPVMPGQTYWRSQVTQVPVHENSTNYLIFKTDCDNTLFESDESNNIAVVPVSFLVQLADLAPISLQAPAVVDGSPNPILKLTWGVTNQGTGPVLDQWSDYVFLSRKSVLDYTAQRIADSWETGPLPAGSSYWRTRTVQLPLTNSGTYYLLLQTGGYSYSLYESDISNNVLSLPVTFNISLPDLAPVAFQAPAIVQGPPNPTVTLVWGVTNQGAGEALTSYVNRVYLSTNSTLDRSTATVLIDGWEGADLTAGGSYWRTNNVRVPITQNGSYYLFFEANGDTYGRLPESNYSNNLVSTPVTFEISQPDLAPLAFLSPDKCTASYSDATLIWGVTNQGVGAASGGPYGWDDLVSLTLSYPDGTVWELGRWTCYQTNNVPPGGTYWVTNTVRLPIVANGTYLLTLTVAAYDDLRDANPNNNSVTNLLLASIAPPDIEPVFLGSQGPLRSANRSMLEIAFGVTNHGPGVARGGNNPYWVDALFLSTNNILDASAQRLASWLQYQTIPAGGSYWLTNKVSLPTLAPGDYYLILQVDADNALHSLEISNNIVVAPIRLELPVPADLTPTLFLVPNIVTGAPNPEITLVWGVTNQGAGPAAVEGGWIDALYLSTTRIADGSELYVGTWRETTRLAPGASYWRTNIVKLPVPATGDYYLFFKTDSAHFVPDSNYGNNDLVVPVSFKILPPDLAPVVLQAAASITGAPNPSVTIVIGVTNQGLGPALAATDELYISGTPVRDPSARSITNWDRTTVIDPGKTYWLTNTVCLPIANSGDYYLIFEADKDNLLNESDLFNNTLAVPLRLDLSLASDLAMKDFLVPAFIAAPANPTVQLVWHVANEGLGPAATPWSESVLLLPYAGSTQGQVVGTFAETNSLAAGAQYWRTNFITLPLTQSGTYFLQFATDPEDHLFELNPYNNWIGASLSFSLTTTSPLWLGETQLSNDGSFTAAVYGTTGNTYSLQTSTDLVSWTEVRTFTCTNSPTWVSANAPTNALRRFYRVAP